MSDDKFASRKFVLTCAAYLTGTAMLAFAKIDAAQWVSYTTIVLGMYFAVNLGDAYVERK